MNLNNWKTKINCRRGELNLAATPACGGICIFQHSKEFSMVNIPTFELECTASWRRNLSRGWQKERNVHTTESVDANAKTRHRSAGKKKALACCVVQWMPLSECHRATYVLRSGTYMHVHDMRASRFVWKAVLSKHCVESILWIKCTAFDNLDAHNLSLGPSWGAGPIIQTSGTNGPFYKFQPLEMSSEKRGT